MNFSSIQRQSLIGKILRLPLTAIPKTAVVPVLQGTLRGTKWIVGSGTHGCWLGSYEYTKQRLLTYHLNPGDVFYDIGANVGFYSLLAARIVGTLGDVYAIEPVPRNLGYLEKHVHMNNLGNVHVLAMALSDQNGTAYFAQSASPSEGKLADQGDISVTVRALDDLILQGHLKSPDVLKIDVEGEEFRVLMGARDTLQRNEVKLFLATHGSEVHEQCVTLLTQFKYTIETIGDTTDELFAYR